MNLLLDTHALLWWLDGGGRLREAARATIADPGSVVVVSVASIWEMAIKRQSGKLDTPDDVEERLEANRFVQLPIRIDHALRAGTLPLHHRDPFDRMLVAQAELERLTIVTRDPRIARYDVQTLAA